MMANTTTTESRALMHQPDEKAADKSPRLDGERPRPQHKAWRALGWMLLTVVVCLAGNFFAGMFSSTWDFGPSSFILWGIACLIVTGADGFLLTRFYRGTRPLRWCVMMEIITLILIIASLGWSWAMTSTSHGGLPPVPGEPMAATLGWFTERF